MIRRAKGTKQRNNAANSDALSRGSDDDASSFAEDDAVNRYFARSDSSSSFDPNSVLGLRNEYSKDLHSKEAQDESNLDNQSRDSVARKRSDTVTPQDMAVIGSLDGNTHRDASTEHGSSTLASYGNQGLPDGDDDSHAQISTSPTKRMSRIGATLSKLHFRSGSSATRREGGASVESSTPAHGLSRRASQESDVAFDFHKGSTSNHGHFMGRKHGSGKHTPVTRDATGDFAQFLQAEELKSKLAKEQDAALKRELKFAKNPKKHKDYAGHGIGGKGKPETPEERWRRRHNVMTDDEDEYLPEGPTLEERGYFPGDLLHHGHLARRRTKGHGSKPTSSESSPQMQTQRIRPPGICGEVSDSNESDAEGESDAVDGDSEAPYLSTPAEEKANIDANTGDNAQRKKTQRPSSISSESSYADSDIVEPHNANSAGGNINPSVMSLKSFKSDHSQGASTLSGGANAKLAKPLLELEELELDSFLKNFGRHTREIRVPHSANFPRRRMPRWEDFRIPPGEAALAKAQGKRVTVLTHVDRGLRALEAAEGEGVPKPRNEEAASDHKHLSSDAKPSKGKHKTKGDKLSASNSEADDLAPSRTSSSQGHPDRPLMTPASSTDKRSPLTTPHQRVSWAPAPEKEASRPGSPEVPLASLRKNMLEKDEKEAKKQEQEGKDHPSFLSGFCGQEASEKSPSNVHAYDVEYRPSRDELDLNDQEWEMLHAPTEEVSAVDDDSQVDGVAWAIAYILATIERYAPEELDNSPDQRYRESKTRSHVERLYLIAPFWERLLYGIRRVYRWDNPRRTSSFMMTYFTLWYMNLLPTAFLLVVMYYTCQFRFFPPSASYLHEQVRLRMARGVDADRLAERLRRRSRLDVLEIYKRFVVAYGDGSQLACGDIADFHEKVKNLILWRNPTATWRTLTLMGITTIFVTFASSHVIWKTTSAFLGFTFFILLPLQSHYPRFRRPLSPVWWALWGSPTDQQFAIQLLRRRHLERQHAKHPPPVGGEEVQVGKSSGPESPPSKGGKSTLKNRLLPRSSAAHAVAYGALRPFRSGTNEQLNELKGGNLLDLQDVKILDGGEIQSRPRKLGSFFCQHHGVPGHLHVTTRMLYFVALHSHAAPGHRGGHKTCKTLLQDISGIVKTKSIRLLVWSSSGLQVLRRNRSSLFFSNMPHRDNAFNLLLAIGSEVWHKQS